MTERLRMPQNWARCNVSAFHSKSSAYASGYREGWEAAQAAMHALTAPMPAMSQPMVSEDDRG